LKSLIDRADTEMYLDKAVFRAPETGSRR